jgi:hypothetical protein
MEDEEKSGWNEGGDAEPRLHGGREARASERKMPFEQGTG